jgi:hypothetical protein
MTVLKATLRLLKKLSQRIGRQLHQKCPAKSILYTVAQSEVPAKKLRNRRACMYNRKWRMKTCMVFEL